MLIASEKNNVSRFIFASSSSVYGDSESLSKIENKIGNPMSPYALTKNVNEMYAEIFSKVYQLDFIGFRYFNVFGRKQNPNGVYAAVIPKFILRILQNKNPIIYGNGSNTRDFTHINNIKEINLKALLTNDNNAINKIFNVAFGESTSLIDLFQLIKKPLINFKMFTK